MIEPKNQDLSIAQRCKLVGISRSGFYAPTRGESEANLELVGVALLEFVRVDVGDPDFLFFLRIADQKHVAVPDSDVVRLADSGTHHHGDDDVFHLSKSLIPV